MNDIGTVAPAFVEMAHRIVWCVAATSDSQGRPRTRILHPLWRWDGETLTGRVATSPLSPKARHLDENPYVSCTYWTPNHDTCSAECFAVWRNDPGSRQRLWDDFSATPEPLGYVPSIIPGWESPEAERFGVLELRPWRLRVMPGSLMGTGQGALLTWKE